MADYIMGLDLGTSSIGVTCIRHIPILNEADEVEIELLDHHVYLFKEPLEGTPSGLVSKKANRRGARQASRQRDRRIGRLQELAQWCDRHLRQGATNANNASHQTGYDPDHKNAIKQHGSLALRAIAATDAVTRDDLTRVILHISKSRGYSSGFKPLSKAQQEKLALATTIDEQAKIITGEVQSGNVRLTQILQLRQCQTVGQYLLDRAQRGLPSILKAGAEGNRVYVSHFHTNAIAEELAHEQDRKTGAIVKSGFANLYALRDQIKAEFKIIWETQQQHDPNLTDDLYRAVTMILFYQRPLKSVQSMVGACLYEPNLPRAPKMHPAFQQFRIEKSIADLRWGMGRSMKMLSADEKQIIRQALNDPSQLDKDDELSFEKIYKCLATIRDPQAPNNLNLARGGRSGIQGNVTAKRWKAMGDDVFAAWQDLARRQDGDADHVNRQNWVIQFFADMGSVELLYQDDWAQQFYLPDLNANTKHKEPRIKKQAAMFKDQRFKDFIDLLRDGEQIDRLSKLKFDSGRASYSIKALNRINQWFIEGVAFDAHAHIDEHQAISSLYAQSQSSQKSVGKLENPSKTGNGVVDVAMMQIKKVVNRMIDLHGKPQTIVIEMTREMGEGLTRRNEIQKDQNKNNTTHKKAKEDMEVVSVAYSKTNVLRYRLAQDQGYQCPYCDQTMMARDIYNGAECQIEHIVPQSISQVGRKYSEIVLAHARCNYKKGKQVPMVAFSFNTAPIEQMAKRLRGLKQDHKAMLLEMDSTPEHKINDDALNDFCDRQFHETAWITKCTATWLRSLGVDVLCTKGQMTAQLRRQWRLDSVTAEARLDENLPLYSTHTPDGEIKECIIPKEAIYDHDGNHSDLWHFWDNQHLSRDQYNALVDSKQLYRYDKRCDHRHHVIDALVTALCTRSMIQKMATEYKRRSEQEALKPVGQQRPIRIGRMAPPVLKIRDLALKMVREQQLTHRPDRKVSGAWFQETAYGLFDDHSDARNPRTYLTSRVKLKSLTGKDNVETIANINAVISPTLKTIIMDDYQRQYRAAGSPEHKDVYKNWAEQIWAAPLMHPQTGYPITKVQVRYKEAELKRGKHIKIEHQSRRTGQRHYKVLIAGENAFIAWNPHNPADGVRVVNAYQASQKIEIPEGWMRAYKGDTILANDDLSYRVFGLAEAQNNLKCMRLVCTTNKTKQSEGQRDFKLTPSKTKSSMDLWDIKSIIEDPFYG